MFKTTKAKLIFVIIFAIICITTTTLLIVYKNIDIEEDNESIEETIVEKQKDTPGIDLRGTYNQNDIELEEKKYSKEKIEIKYYQISGLKDKTIQENINKDIEHIALNCYKQKIENLDDVKNVSVNIWNLANFANTLSFEVNYYAKVANGSDDFYQDTIGLNYDLTTGEKITIDKMFTADVPIENVLRNSAYYSFVMDKSEETLSGDRIISDYGEIEEEVAEIINLYKNGEITNFCFTPKSIIIIYKVNKIITIDMEKYAEYMAIYSRYLKEESIYERKDIGLKNLYTLCNRADDIFYYTNYQKGKNYFIDINLEYIESQEQTEIEQNLLKEKIQKIETEIEKVKQLSEQNPNEFYILNYEISNYAVEEESTKQILIKYYEIGNTYEMTIHDFEENIEPIIIQHNRDKLSVEGTKYLYNFSEQLKIEPQETIEYYNPLTGEKVVI